MSRRFGIGGGSVTGRSGSGGTPFNPQQKNPINRKQKEPGSQTQDPGYTPDLPPFLADPSIAAQRDAADRGLKELEANTKTKEHFKETDLHQALRDIRTNTSRQRGTINRDAFRAGQTLNNQEQDATTRGRRQNEDFDSQLQNIGRQFAQLGHRQGEAANQAGVLDTGTQAASAVARSRNQGLAEAPIAVARSRSGEDLATALSRIGTARSNIGEDQTRSLTHLTQDRNRDRKLTHQERNREAFENKRKEERAREEKEFSDEDLLRQEVYAARQENPAAYAQWAREHPGLLPGAGGGQKQGPGVGISSATSIGKRKKNKS